MHTGGALGSSEQHSARFFFYQRHTHSHTPHTMADVVDLEPSAEDQGMFAGYVCGRQTCGKKRPKGADQWRGLGWK